MESLDRYLTALHPVSLVATMVGAAALLVGLGWCLGAMRREEREADHASLVEYAVHMTRAACTDAVARDRVQRTVACYTTAPWHARMAAAARDDLGVLADAVSDDGRGRHRATRPGGWWS